jgi:pyruvate,water dikinase
VSRRFAVRAGDLLGLGDDVFLLTIEELRAALDGDRAPLALLDIRREALRRQRELPPLPGIICGLFDPVAWAADRSAVWRAWSVGSTASTTPIDCFPGRSS